jgi:ADP-ribosyl-[dinitrogen reductase] hydrolase
MDLNMRAIKGMFYGLTIGDCLGMPYEFNRREGQGVSKYSEKIITTTFNNQWWGPRTTALGQGSDDSEMTFALFDTLKKNNFKYDRNLVILRYMEFASHSSFLGQNTVALFKGVKTLRGYKGRCEKTFKDNVSQSNGSLMRISPLVFCCSPDPEDILKIVIEDTSISNPTPANYAYGFIFLYILRNLVDKDFKKENLIDIINFSISFASDKFKDDISFLKEDLPDISGEDKGWVRHACHCAVYSILKQRGSFSEQIKNIVIRGGDTDTTASVSGCLLGALLYEEMEKEPITVENMKTVRECDTTKGDYPKPEFITFKVLESLNIL